MPDRVVPPRLLILWDVDHTLICAGDFHTRLYRRAFERLIGQPPDELISMSGRTDLESMTTTLRLNGLEPTSDRLCGFADALVEAMHASRELLEEMGEQAKGAAAAVRMLANDPSAVQAIVTGNLKSLAVAKLETLGMLSHLDVDVGGYGWDSVSRGRLVEAARQRASEKYGACFSRRNTVVTVTRPKTLRPRMPAALGSSRLPLGKAAQRT